MDHIRITGMSCEHCKKAAEQALSELGLEAVRVDLEGGTAAFEPNGAVSADAIRQAIEDAGFEMEPLKTI